MSERAGAIRRTDRPPKRPTRPSAPASRLTSEEQTVYDFVSRERPNVGHFLESAKSASANGTPEALAAHLDQNDGRLRSIYERWLAMDLVGGRVHTLERSYESVLRSMLVVDERLRATLSALSEGAVATEGTNVNRAVLVLATRLGWTDRELEVLRADAGGGTARKRRG